jgi:hypothetical protein
MAKQIKFDNAFAFVKSKQKNEKPVTIGESIDCLLDPTISSELKTEIGLMILAMIVDQKKRNVLNIPDEALTKIAEKIVDIITE